MNGSLRVKRWVFLKSRTIHFHINRTSVIRRVKWNHSEFSQPWNQQMTFGSKIEWLTLIYLKIFVGQPSSSLRKKNKNHDFNYFVNGFQPVLKILSKIFSIPVNLNALFITRNNKRKSGKRSMCLLSLWKKFVS